MQRLPREQTVNRSGNMHVSFTIYFQAAFKLFFEPLAVRESFGVLHGSLSGPFICNSFINDSNENGIPQGSLFDTSIF